MAIDLKLDSNQDLVLENGDLVLVTDGEEVIQSASINLLWIQGEWVFDYTKGVPWFDEMLSTETSEEEKKQIIKNVLLAVQGVRRVLQLEYFLDPIEHASQIEFTVDTIHGVISSRLTI